MRLFSCPVCGTDAGFTARTCAHCGVALGYEPERDDLVALVPCDATSFVDATLDAAAAAAAPRRWRCLNAAWGCNWVLDAAGGDVWCRSCRLTRGRPDAEHPDAVDAWAEAEAAKRRVVRQMFVLRVPIEPVAPVGAAALDTLGGVVFDLVHLDAERPGVTGHRPGVITLDLREADHRFRDAARRSLGEADRTLLGHLRHEMGHHCWRVLVEARGRQDACRAVFGDERLDYAAALAADYARPLDAVPAEHLTRYAGMHPAEDWAETFAHHLAMQDALETADQLRLRTPGIGESGEADEAGEAGLDPFVRWRALGRALGLLAEGLGHPAPYPYVLTAEVETKMRFIAGEICDATAAPEGTPT